ncbi:T9SS C-terminal target domain-containing protein [Ferruginibacter sp. HRS2-29]|nr:T9SS C-terminal target domain-containing protein [Ferruginibacter sp. HRS2-29]
MKTFCKLFGINLVGIVKEIVIFTLLKNIFVILIFIIGLNFTSFAQNKIPADNGAIQAKLLKVYPIPAYTVINFDFQRGYDKSYSIQIYNFIGKKVYENKNVPNRLNVNLEDFFRGIYIYQLRDKNGVIIESGKFQVVK